ADYVWPRSRQLGQTAEEKRRSRGVGLIHRETDAVRHPFFYAPTNPTQTFQHASRRFSKRNKAV
ncbi:MAG: hypothetical protein KA993_08575, partial [Neisseria sp.]|nr:hypothetical protein [Neisseria sp.]MBP7969189.1 hypothetical protein [Neisseria sp.]